MQVTIQSPTDLSRGMTFVPAKVDRDPYGHSTTMEPFMEGNSRKDDEEL